MTSGPSRRTHSRQSAPPSHSALRPGLGGPISVKAGSTGTSGAPPAGRCTTGLGAVRRPARSSAARARSSAVRARSSAVRARSSAVQRPARSPEIGRGRSNKFPVRGRSNTFPTGQIQRFRFPSSRSGPAGGDVQVIGTVSAHPRVSPPPSPPDPSRLGPPGRGTKTGGWERPPG